MLSQAVSSILTNHRGETPVPFQNTETISQIERNNGSNYGSNTNDFRWLEMNKDERHIRILSILNSFKAGRERDKIAVWKFDSASSQSFPGQKDHLRPVSYAVHYISHVFFS